MPRRNRGLVHELPPEKQPEDDPFAVDKVMRVVRAFDNSLGPVRRRELPP